MAEAPSDLILEPAPPEPEERERLVLLRASGEWYAIEITAVREVHPVERITRVPNAAPEVRGITTWRGKVLVLYDLSRCLGVPVSALPAERFAVVLDLSIPELDAALLAEEVAEIRAVPLSQIDMTPMLDGERSRGGRVKGWADVDGVEVSILNVGKFFSHLAEA